MDIDENPSGSIDPGRATGPEQIYPPQENPVITLPEWGPSYLVIFKMKLRQFSGQVIYFGTEVGEGVPSVVASRNKKLDITTTIRGKEISASTKTLKTNTEYTISISQKPSSRNRKQVYKTILNSSYLLRFV